MRELVTYIVCPHCGNAMRHINRKWVCPVCGHTQKARRKIMAATSHA